MQAQPLEAAITKTILRHSLRELEEYTETDVVVVGAGPSGLTAAHYLARGGYRVLVLERRLSFGGGIGGGGNLFHKIVAGPEAEEILRDTRVRYTRDPDTGLLVMDAAELAAKLAAAALDAGAKILLGVHVEDVVYREDPLRITGVVVTWSAIPLAGLHVDPVFITAKAVLDATGHEAEVLRIVEKKLPQANLRLHGERSAHSSQSEKLVVEHTGRVLPGLYAAGMAVAALHGLPRMGPIFSSMLLSGRKAAQQIAHDLTHGSGEPSSPHH